MASSRPGSTAGGAALLGAAAGALGLALQIHNGEYDPYALALVAGALVATGAAVWGATPELGRRALVVLLAALLVGELALALAQPIALEMAPGGRAPFRLMLLLAAGGLAATAQAGRARPWLIVGCLALYFAAGVWLLQRAPAGTDVFNFQRGALEALRHGRDPYAIKFRNIYAPYEGFYGPGLVVKGVLQFGYPYPPLPLFLAGAALPFGDIRYAHLAALTLSGAAILAGGAGPVTALAAGLLLFSPRFGLLLQMSWTEPFLILFLSLVVLAARRAPRLVPLALGLLLATKQYLVLLLPAVALLVPRERLARTLGVAAAVAAAITLPMALWDPEAFTRSVVTLQFHQPFRVDALSFLSALVRAGGPPLAWAPLVLGPLAAALALWRAPRTPAGFAAAVAFTFLVFFAFNKQAFCNYYFFVIGALAVSVGAAERYPAST
jgi:hypothetical protein